MIHADLDHGDLIVSGSGLTMIEEYKAITSRLMNYLKECGKDKEKIYHTMQKSLALSLADVFPEEE